jgi:hypothetical protein
MDHPFKLPFSGPVVDHRGIVRKYKLPIGQAESLEAMTEEYVFFTIAPLYLRGNFRDAMLVDYMMSMGEEVKFYYYKFNKPIFKGLETSLYDRDWNHVLWAIGQEWWDSFQDFCCSLTVALRDQNWLVRFGVQEARIIDPLALDKAGMIRHDLPKPGIALLGVYGNKDQFAFEIGEPLTSLPTLKRLPPEEDMRVFAKALFEGQNPLNARELYILDQPKEES